MGRKVRNKQYRNKTEFIADLNLIWDNCLTYNAHPVSAYIVSDLLGADALVRPTHCEDVPTFYANGLLSCQRLYKTRRSAQRP